MVMHVNQCEYGCGIVGHHDLSTGEIVGDLDIEEHYKICPIKNKWGDRALERDYRELEKEEGNLEEKKEREAIYNEGYFQAIEHVKKLFEKVKRKDAWGHYQIICDYEGLIKEIKEIENHRKTLNFSSKSKSI